MSSELIPSDPHLRGQVEAGELLDILVNSARAVNQLVSDMFDVNLIDLQRIPLTLATLDLGNAVTEACKLMQPTLGSHRIQIRVPANPVCVRADPTRLGQILANLLSNAGKYSKPGSEVIVEVKPNHREARVAVSNLGEHLPAPERTALFDRYYRAIATRKTTKGSGLGLAIVKGLVEAHGGQVEVASSLEGFNTFSFTLPIVPSAPRASQ